MKGLRALKDEGLIENLAVVSTDREKRVTDDRITIFPVEKILESL